VIGVGGGPLPCYGQYSFGQRLKILQPMSRSRARVYKLEMWQEVKELATLFTRAEQFELSTNNVRDPAIIVAMEVWAHVSENGIRHGWMGFHPRLCGAGQHTDP